MRNPMPAAFPLHFLAAALAVSLVVQPLAAATCEEVGRILNADLQTGWSTWQTPAGPFGKEQSCAAMREVLEVLNELEELGEDPRCKAGDKSAQQRELARIRGLVSADATKRGCPIRPRPTGDVDRANAGVREFVGAGKLQDAIIAGKRALELAEQKHGVRHSRVLGPLNNLAESYRRAGRLDEAEPLLRRAIAVAARKPDPPLFDAAASFKNLALIEKTHGAYEAAIPHYREAIAIFDSLAEAELARLSRRELADNLQTLARSPHASARSTEQHQQWLTEALQLYEAAAGPQHLDTALAAYFLALHLRDHRQPAEAEMLLDRAVAVFEKDPAVDDRLRGLGLANLADSKREIGKLSEAEPIFRRALSHLEKSPETTPKDMQQFLQNFAWLYIADQRFVQADLLLTRSFEEAGKTDDAELIISAHNNLAYLKKVSGDIDRAAELYGAALVRAKASLPVGHPLTVRIVSNLGHVSMQKGDLAAAETQFRDAVAMGESVSPPDPAMMVTLLGNLSEAQGRAKNYEAEGATLNRALLLIDQHGLSYHKDLRAILDTKVALDLRLGNDEAAAASARRLRDLVLKQASEGIDQTLDQTERGKWRFLKATRQLLAYVPRALWQLAKRRPAERTRLSEETFLAAQWANQSEAGNALNLMSARLAGGSPDLARRARERDELAEQRARLNYFLAFSLQKPAHLRDQKVHAEIVATLTDIERRQAEINQALRRDHPAYLRLVEPRAVPLGEVKSALRPDEALILTFDTVEVTGLPGETFVWAVTSEGIEWTRMDAGTKALEKRIAAFRRDLDSTAGGTRAAITLGPAEAQSLRFDLDEAHRFYREVLGPFEKLLNTKKHLIIIASGPLTALPFQALTTAPAQAGVGEDALKRTEWLVRRHALSFSPSITSFVGDRGPNTRQVAARSIFAVANPVFGAGSNLQPLPETENEVSRVAATLGAGAELLIGPNAREADLKRSPLDQFRILYFATHGLIAGETANLNEPALALTSPAQSTNDDNGLLTASEVAALRLNADWVVLSACNTAAGDRPGAEALSGLARAFFYAGARSLLVSHWPVRSAAAVTLTTRTFAELQRSPELGRAEGLRRAMVHMIDNGTLRDAHPSSWAPFVLVGDGSPPR